MEPRTACSPLCLLASLPARLIILRKPQPCGSEPFKSFLNVGAGGAFGLAASAGGCAPKQSPIAGVRGHRHTSVNRRYNAEFTSKFRCDPDRSSSGRPLVCL